MAPYSYVDRLPPAPTRADHARLRKIRATHKLLLAIEAAAHTDTELKWTLDLGSLWGAEFTPLHAVLGFKRWAYYDLIKELRDDDEHPIKVALVADLTGLWCYSCEGLRELKQVHAKFDRLLACGLVESVKDAKPKLTGSGAEKDDLAISVALEQFERLCM